MKIRTVIRAILLLGFFSASGRANTVVHDPIHTVLNVAQQLYGQVKQEAQHLEDITKYTTMIQKQLEQINQLTNIVNATPTVRKSGYLHPHVRSGRPARRG
jgi:hypothetical protein